MTDVNKTAVIGTPISHSLSPKIHNYWLNKYSIVGEYIAIDIPRASFDQAIKDLFEQGIIGLNVTVPYKEKVIEQLDRLTNVAQQVGAVNTIYKNKQGEIIGDNTDIIGFSDNIKNAAPKFDFTVGAAVVLGAGGAARAIIASLMKEQVPQIILTNRTKARAEQMKEEFGGNIILCDWQDKDSALADANLLVNTTSLGMQGQPTLQVNLDKLPKTSLVNDIVYKPLTTDLLSQAKDRGNLTVDGLGMLLYQAAPSFELWYNTYPQIDDELREYILEQ